MNKIAYVTSFLDINRESWDIWERRSIITYLEYFMNQLPLFKNAQDHVMFVYLDEKLVPLVKPKITKEYSVHLIPLSEEFLRDNCPMWSRLERETEIMNSEWFRQIVRDRLKYPECSQPRYTMIMNVKIDLMIHTFQLTDADMFCWVDFGYVKLPEVLPHRLLDINKFDHERVNFSLVNYIQESDYDIMKTLVNPREIFEGGFYVARRTVLYEYQKLFYEVHNIFHTMGIVDDDQHILLQCYRRKPNLFKLHYQGKWLKSLRHFQLDDVPTPPPPTSNIVVEMCGGVGNQLFQIATGYALAKKTNSNLLILRKPDYDLRQGSKPEKYFSSIYYRLRTTTTPTESVGHIKEAKWAYYDISNEALALKQMGVKNIIISGFYQSENHFREYRNDLQKLFIPKEGIIEFLKKQEEQIFPELFENHDYCFIGVRRTDYITYPEHNPCGMNYYSQAMEIMNKERYYIASDDIEWCKKKFIGKKYRFFDVKDDLTQLMAITLFNNYIIANSTYNWWGTYMSTYSNPKIVAPNLWLGGKDATFDSYSSIYRKEMIVVPRIVETD